MLIWRQPNDDAMIAVAVESDTQWQGLAGLVGGEAANICDLAGRRAREEQIEAVIANWCASRDASAALADAGVPAALLRNVRELQDHPQLRERGFFTRLTHAVIGDLEYPNFPFRFDGQYLPIRSPAPLLGEHNEAILGGLLGLSGEKLEALERDGVIGTRPSFAG